MIIKVLWKGFARGTVDIYTQRARIIYNKN